MAMTPLELAIEEVVAANRILAAEGIVDAFGHASVRHPDRPDRFLLSRLAAPQLVSATDVIQFDLDGTPLDAGTRRPYLERFIHAALYAARPDIRGVVHTHSHSVVPFGVTGAPLQPLMHTCAPIGLTVPVWDSRTAFGETGLLVSNLAMGRDLARAVGGGTTALMRGHGCVTVGATVRDAVFVAVGLVVNAEIQMRAAPLGPITFLTPGEVEQAAAEALTYGVERAWEYWCVRAGVPYRARPS
jgi:HCOMODA/2-hydroxy-3-carboxy-muconic semialdehyde decarboxylase